MRKSVLIVGVVAWLIFAVVSNSFAWGKKNATGQITSINHAGGSVPNVTVQGYTEGSLYLGLSFKCDGGWEDRKPKKVKGKFTKSFSMRLCPQGYSTIRACLWKKKSGGLMEGRVDCMDE